MARIDDLVHNYGRQVALPWERKLAGAQRVWFAVYDKNDERRLRNRLGDFEIKTREAGHTWALHDCTDAFPHWLAGRKYRDSYFEAPELLHSAYSEFQAAVVAGVRATLTQPTVDQDTVVAILGVGCLFGFVRVSEIVNAIESEIRGRLLVFFPGEHEANNYRLLDARDGWNYLAIPITSSQGANLE